MSPYDWFGSCMGKRVVKGGMFVLVWEKRWSVRSLPTDSYGEGSLTPVSACDYGHLAQRVGARAVKYLV